METGQGQEARDTSQLVGAKKTVTFAEEIASLSFAQVAQRVALCFAGDEPQQSATVAMYLRKLPSNPKAFDHKRPSQATKL